MPVPPHTISPIRVAAVGLLDEEGRVLMQRRHAGGEHGGLWEFPGGKVEPGETPEAAAVREIQEELGLAIDPSQLFAAGSASGFKGSGDSLRVLEILLFACRHWAGEPEPRAASAIGWYRPEMLGELAMPPLDYPLAEEFLRWLHENVI